MSNTATSRTARKWTCDYRGCGRVFGSKQAVSVHRWQQHGVNSTEPRAARKRRQKAREVGFDATENFICRCGLGFALRSDFARHRLTENHYPHTDTKRS